MFEKVTVCKIICIVANVRPLKCNLIVYLSYVTFKRV